MTFQYHFGTRTVSRAGREQAVAGVFASVAQRYDLMNDLMSAGLHRLWKRSMVALAAPQPNEAWLDLATGSGDIAALLAAPKQAGSVTAADPSSQMLAQAQRRFATLPNVQTTVCSAEQLPFATRSFAGVTCAFGLRNFTAIPEALAEITRVLEPGGRVILLEFSPPQGLTSAWQRRYLTEVLPVLGALVVSDEPSYRYLADSIIDFAPPAQVASWLEDAGLVEVQWRTFAAGAVALHRAWKTW